MMFGAWGNADHDDSIRIIHRALDAGINFVDTADVYSGGESEEIVGKALKGRRDDVVLATKFHMPMDEDPNHRGNRAAGSSRRSRTGCDGCGTDWIDLYQVHRPTRRPTSRRRSARSPTSSSRARSAPSARRRTPAAEIVEAQWASRERRLERFRTEQPPYSLLVRGIELDVLPTAQRHGMGVLTYSPLAGGWLSAAGRADSSPTSPARQRLAARFDMSLPENQRKLEAVEELASSRRSRTDADPAGDRVRRPPPGGDLGDRRPAHDGAAREPAPAADAVLDATTLDRIDEIVAPGVKINPEDNSYGTDELEPTARRR